MLLLLTFSNDVSARECCACEEGKNNKTFSDKRKPFKWQGRKKEIRASIYKGEKSAHLRAAHNQHTFHIHSRVRLRFEFQVGHSSKITTLTTDQKLDHAFLLTSHPNDQESRKKLGPLLEPKVLQRSTSMP